jgi:hypothetical protein
MEKNLNIDTTNLTEREKRLVDFVNTSSWCYGCYPSNIEQCKYCSRGCYSLGPGE